MYNLLLVDDEPLIKVAFQSAVEWGKNGFLLAATASNGQEALHIVETQHIDAVITDLKMPGMDGLALIHELKKRSFIGPILVLSNYSDFDSVRAALTDGAYDYFLKINMNGESIGEHLEKMADLLRVQQQRQTEEDHRSFAIEAQKKENALIHCAQWVTSTAEPSPASNPFSMLPEPLSFPIRLFTVTLIPAKTHPMPALDAVTDLITEVFDEISGKVFTEKKEAGAALLAVCKDMKAVDAAMDIGNYQGFNMRIQFDSWSKEFILSVKHESVSKVHLGADALGNITRINNLLESYPEKLAEAEQRLETVQEQLTNAKEEVGKPFTKEEELNQKLERLSELNALLNMDEREDTEAEQSESKEKEERPARGSIHEKLQIYKEKSQRESENGREDRKRDFGLE